MDILAGEESVRIKGSRFIRVSSKDESAHLFVETGGGERVDIIMGHLFGYFIFIVRHGNMACRRLFWGKQTVTLSILGREVIFRLLPVENAKSSCLPNFPKGVPSLIAAFLLLLATLCVPVVSSPLSDTMAAAVFPITKNSKQVRPEICLLSAISIRDLMIRGEISKTKKQPSIIPLLAQMRALARKRGQISLYRKYSTFLFLIYKKRRVNSYTNP